MHSIVVILLMGRELRNIFHIVRKPLCMSHCAVGTTGEVLLTLHCVCLYSLWNFAVSRFFTLINTVSPRQIILYLLHLSIKTILIVTLKYNFLNRTRSHCSPSRCFSILAGHDNAWTSRPTLSFTADVCIHSPQPTPRAWNSGHHIKGFN